MPKGVFKIGAERGWIDSSQAFVAYPTVPLHLGLKALGEIDLVAIPLMNIALNPVEAGSIVRKFQIGLKRGTQPEGSLSLLPWPAK